MDLTCFNWIQLIKKSELPANAKLISFYLSTFMNAEQDIAWPSQSRIAGETGISEPTVRKYLALLAEKQWLIIKKNGHILSDGRQNYHHNEYLINIPEQRVRALLSDMSRGKTGDEQRVNSQRAEGKELTTNNNRNNNRSNNRYKSEKPHEVLSSPPVKQCPVTEIINLYHEVLPFLPQCKKITSARRAAIRQRHFEDMERSLEIWRDYFEFVKDSDFLTGKTTPSNSDRRP